MNGGDKTAERRRLAEALAQSLYEDSDPGGVPWARRPRVVRDAWLLRAEQQLSGSDGQSSRKPATTI